MPPKAVRSRRQRWATGSRTRVGRSRPESVPAVRPAPYRVQPSLPAQAARPLRCCRKLSRRSPRPAAGPSASPIPVTAAARPRAASVMTAATARSDYSTQFTASPYRGPVVHRPSSAYKERPAPAPAPMLPQAMKHQQQQQQQQPSRWDAGGGPMSSPRPAAPSRHRSGTPLRGYAAAAAAALGAADTVDVGTGGPPGYGSGSNQPERKGLGRMEPTPATPPRARRTLSLGELQSPQPPAGVHKQLPRLPSSPTRR